MTAWCGAIAGANRISRIAPALTTPACISADTGVGAANVNGNQPWKGIWLDRANAETTSSAAQVS